MSDVSIDAHYDRSERRDLSASFFPGGIHAEHRRHITTWWCEGFGGPAEYSGQLGGNERMIEKHRNPGIKSEQRLRFASPMSLAADGAGLPDDPEFRSALVAYLERGARVSPGNSETDAAVMEHAPIPHWDWREAPPHHAKSSLTRLR